MFKKIVKRNKTRTTSTIGYKSVITSLPVTQIKNGHYRLESDHNNGIIHSLADKYMKKTGITITNDYELHIFHIDEILGWEQTKEAIGPFFTSLLTQGTGDPLTHIASLLATARVYKNIIVIEVDDKSKLDKIKDTTLKFTIDAETIFID